MRASIARLPRPHVTQIRFPLSAQIVSTMGRGGGESTATAAAAAAAAAASVVDGGDDKYASTAPQGESSTPYQLQNDNASTSLDTGVVVARGKSGSSSTASSHGVVDPLITSPNGQRINRDDDDGSSGSDETANMSLSELLYSSSSYYAIAKPVTITMILSALTVVYMNNDETRAQGQAAMASAYQVWSNNSGSAGGNLMASLGNALVMVSVICGMTFGIVLLYKFRCIKCLIGYMIMCSGTLLGILGGNLLEVGLQIYRIPVDKPTFFLFMANFAFVGVLSVFWGQGIPKYMTQAYLICTSVILAWHLSYFDAWTCWTLLFMLALYDLCAVLTPCGPLKFLVELMSREDSPDMPGLLYEAQLPPEAKRPGVPRTPRNSATTATPRARSRSPSRTRSTQSRSQAPAEVGDQRSAARQGEEEQGEGPKIEIPLAIAKVYNLSVVAVPAESTPILFPQRYNESSASAAPLLTEGQNITLSDNPTPKMLRALVTVQLPAMGGRIEAMTKRGKTVFLERDRHGEPKRILWVDRAGKVFAELKADDDDVPDERNSIRLGLGDFIFYSVLVAKAAQYSFCTFAACMLVILAGLGGTLVLLSVYHHALPALPISILLGICFYALTRWSIEPWIEDVLRQPYYV